MTIGYVTSLLTGFLAAEGGEEGGSNIEIGEHVERHWGPLTVNIDTIASTVVAGLIVLSLGFCAALAADQVRRDHVPTKLQLIWESVVGEVNRQVEDNLGKVHPYVAPLAIALFFFILFANWLELIPSKLNEDSHHLLAAPTADTNLTYALAAVTIVSVWVYGIRTKGVKGYFSHFLEPFPVLLPLNILEELVKPITLGAATLRQHLRRRHHARADRADPDLGQLGAQHPLEGLRHVHRRHPGVHLRAADRPLLRHGRCRPRRARRGARR